MLLHALQSLQVPQAVDDIKLGVHRAQVDELGVQASCLDGKNRDGRVGNAVGGRAAVVAEVAVV